MAKNDSAKDFYDLLHNAFYDKMIESVRNRLRLEFIQKFDF